MFHQYNKRSYQMELSTQRKVIYKKTEQKDQAPPLFPFFAIKTGLNMHFCSKNTFFILI
ncbi:hypothetical protein SAMN05661044_01870 [Olivibacter domesticus]|uniref:Uncharacterized protein n=1 Tax=Olivibacter domesticus TaxID=407022 RepID=A0A1H7M5B8_OLID1|nr:hypothetical protein SAMN05661044_01870 [Olivibacter domesticus]